MHSMMVTIPWKQPPPNCSDEYLVYFVMDYVRMFLPQHSSDMSRISSITLTTDPSELCRLVRQNKRHRFVFIATHIFNLMSDDSLQQRAMTVSRDLHCIFVQGLLRGSQNMLT